MRRVEAEKVYSWVTKKSYEDIADESWPSYEVFCKHANIPQVIYNDIDSMLRPYIPFEHPSFCVNPFYSLEIPENTSCCLLPRFADVERIKQQMLDGKRPPDCAKCWNLEDSGRNSDRLLKNKTLDFYSNIDLHQLLKLAQDNKNKTTMYKIDTSNACNATCVTCGEHLSTGWQQLLNNNDIIATSKKWTVDKQTLDSNIDYNEAKCIVFRGGEPLLSNQNFVVLEKLIQAGNTDCFISFVTNGSIRPTAKQTELIKQFTTVNFCFSIDGIGPVFDYLRYPLEWSVVEDNVQWARQQGFVVSVSYTKSNLNRLYEDETFKWLDKFDIDYLINPVYVPNYFAPQIWPGDDAYKSKLWEACKQEIARQDQLKGISINDYLPELAAILQQ